VDDADHVVAEGDDVGVGCGKGEAEGFERLVGEGGDVGEGVLRLILLDLFLPQAAADEHEADGGVVLEFDGCFEERLERVGGGMVAGVHHDELAFEVVGFAEGVFGVI